MMPTIGLIGGMNWEARGDAAAGVGGIDSGF